MLNLTPVSKKRYYSDNTSIRVGVLLENSSIVAIVVHDSILIHLQGNTASDLQDFDVNKVKHDMCFESIKKELIWLEDPEPNAEVLIEERPLLEHGSYGLKEYDNTIYDCTLYNLYSNELERVMSGLVNILKAHKEIHERDYADSVFFKSYESYAYRLKPNHYEGAIDTQTVVDIVFKNYSKIWEYMRQMYAKTNIIDDTLSNRGESVFLTTYSFCYCLL